MSKPIYMRTAKGEVFTTTRPEWNAECENLGSGAKGAEAMQEYARQELRKIIKPKMIVRCVLRKVSASGMSRDISFFIVEKGAIRNIDGLISDACGYRISKHGAGLTVGGCGMDMGFSVVYSLGRALWPKGTRKPHGMRNGVPDKDGGYALKHEWL